MEGRSGDPCGLRQLGHGDPRVALEQRGAGAHDPLAVASSVRALDASASVMAVPVRWRRWWALGWLGWRAHALNPTATKTVPSRFDVLICPMAGRSATYER